MQPKLDFIAALVSCLQSNRKNCKYKAKLTHPTLHQPPINDLICKVAAKLECTLTDMQLHWASYN